MIIEITTTREINDDDFDGYIDALLSVGIPIDRENFRKNKHFLFKDDKGQVITAYRIVPEKELSVFSVSRLFAKM